MKKVLSHISNFLTATILMVVAGIYMVGCSIDLDGRGGDLQSSGSGIPVSFALSLESGSAGDVQTKMSTTVTQAGGTSTDFRGIQYVYAIPFEKHASQSSETTESPILASDIRWFENLALRQAGIPNAWADNAGGGNHPGLVNSNNSHLYGMVYVKPRTGSMLIYGKATADGSESTPDGKHVNGVLEPTTITVSGTPYPSLLAAEFAGEIGFNLQPIAQADVVSTAIGGLLDYLSSIANTVLLATWSSNAYPLYSQTDALEQYRLKYTWAEPSSYSNNTTLRNQYNTFVAITTIDAYNLNTVLSNLYSALNNLSGGSATGYYNDGSWHSTSYGYVSNLAQAVRANVNNSQYVTVSGNNVTLKPDYDITASIGIPAGATRIAWNNSSKKFELSTSSATVHIGNADVPLAPLSSFCYPPSLWYYTNSNIRVSDSQEIDGEYKSANSTWTTIVNKYSYGTVASRTTSAAVVKPLNYGVGRLLLNVNSVSSYRVRDNNNDWVRIDNTYFPLTGIIVGGQRNLNFDFTPKNGLVYYIYDNKVSTGYISQTTASTATNTLVVQTIDGDDIRFALEFQNNSGSSFTGYDGTVPAGGRFYLIGELKYSSASGTQRSSSVFRQDLVTEVSVSINSLANAFNTIPDFRSEMLQIGVETQMKWIQATPAENPLY